jgi:hypothetical protein
MFSRVLSSVALVACTVVYAFAANDRATFILTDGERKSGTVVYHGDQHENLINGYLNLGVDNAKDMTFPIEQVAVIDFVGGQPPASELAQLGTRHLLVLRNGTTQPGRFINMTGGNTLVWESDSSQRQQYAIRDVSRVYLNAQSARTAFGYQAPSTPADTRRPAASSTTVRVDAKQAWTDTGLVVNRGDHVAFEASGQIQFGQYGGQTATPDGNPLGRGATFPDPSVPVGALLGRIGNSAPFAIGMQRQPLVMPAAGRLMLGINDDDVRDNSGYFTVIVSRP